MKSKISFFNKTVFRKNVTLYWPMWTLYLLVLLLLVPGTLWVRLHNLERYYTRTLTQNDGLYAIYLSVNMPKTIFIVFVMAVVTGMALYNYLYTTKSANMIHALPVTRGELFGTNVITGLLFLLLPEIFAFVGGVIVCLSFGMTCVEYLGMWLLVVMVTAVFAYGMVTFCAMLTGQLVALPVYFAAFNVLYLVIHTVVSSVIAYMGYGLPEKGMDEFGLTCLSPVYYLMKNVYLKAHMVYKANEYNCEELVMEGAQGTAWYLIPAVVFFLAAYLLYKHRKLEHAGDVVAVPVLKPVFRWGIGFVLGFLTAVWTVSMLESIVAYVQKGIVLLVAVLAGVVFFFAAEMLIRKNFRVFQKRVWIECGVFALCMLAASGCMAAKAYAEEQYVPEQEEIAKASVNYTYSLTFDGEECGQVLAWHQFLAENADELERAADGQNTWYVTIEYQRKDGTTFWRSYQVPIVDETEPLFESLNVLAADADQYTAHLFGSVNPDTERYSGGYLEIMDESWNVVSDVTVGSGAANIIAEAVLADIEAGTLQKYNIYDPLEQNEAESYACYLALYGDSLQSDWDDYWEKASLNGEFYMVQESVYGDVWISFGDDCENIIRALIETGLVESTDEFYYASES